MVISESHNIPDSAVSVFPTPGGPASKMMTPFPAHFVYLVLAARIQCAVMQTFARNDVIPAAFLLPFSVHESFQHLLLALGKYQLLKCIFLKVNVGYAVDVKFTLSIRLA